MKMPQMFFGCDNVVDCAGCGELYCSAECQGRDYVTGHRLLCVGPLSTTDHPLYQYKMHAFGTNEEFLLAGKVVARVACRMMDQSESLAEATAEFGHFQSGLWWDVAGVLR
jgi:hypothetical protein